MKLKNFLYRIFFDRIRINYEQRLAALMTTVERQQRQFEDMRLERDNHLKELLSIAKRSADWLCVQQGRVPMFGADFSDVRLPAPQEKEPAPEIGAPRARQHVRESDQDFLRQYTVHPNRTDFAQMEKSFLGLKTDPGGTQNKVAAGSEPAPETQ